MAKQASIVETHRIALEAMLKGTTDAQFRADFAKLLADNGGSVVPISRADLIFGNADALAYSAGRIEQMRRVADDRPFLMYPLGPDDDHTTDFCRLMQGYIAPINAEVWKGAIPPNHHKERHVSMLSLTAAQAKERGYKDDESDGEYPVVDGQQMIPDPGFDMQPAILASDSGALATDFASLQEVIAAGDAESYALEDLAAIAEEDIPEAPELAGDAGDAEAGWNALREAADIPEDLEETILPDLFGDGAIVNRGSYDAVFGDTSPELAPLLPELLTDPLEVWFVPYQTDAGVTAVKRYLGAFVSEGETIWLWADASPSGWIARGGVASSAADLEKLRTGYLATSKVPAKGDRP